MAQLDSLSETRLVELLAPYIGGRAVPDGLYRNLAIYLDLLLRWNAHTNLTSIREPEEIAQRHFGESLFAGLHLASCLGPGACLLDFGSGAGFPGLPIQLLLPGMRVTLAESQGKKVAFLREVVRTLSLPTEVWADRVEAMPPERNFGAVTLRAVDRMQEATNLARSRIVSGGWLVTFPTEPAVVGETYPLPGFSHGWVKLQQVK